MFTGIIEKTAPVLEKADDSITLERPSSFDDIKLGSSIAVSGICLSVISLDEKKMVFDVMSETWERTTLQYLTVGDSVNLERSLKMGDRLEGHVVQGHVEAVASVTSYKLQVTGSSAELCVELPEALLSCVVEKGSIAIDGVSLTIAALDCHTMTIGLIPHTLEHTTLGSLQAGDQVNIETDVLMRSLIARRS